MYKLVPKDSGYLFASFELRGVFEVQRRELQREVESLEANRLLNTSPSDLATYLIDKYSIEPLVLKAEQWSADQKEVGVDVSRDWNRFPFEKPRGPYHIPGQRIEVTVPFEGDKDLAYCRPSTFSSPPRGTVAGNSIKLSWDMAHDAPRDVRPEIDRAVAEIQQYVDRIHAEVVPFNGTLLGEATKAIESRRQRLLANQGRLASLGIPVRERSDVPKTYAVPSVRRKAPPALPAAASTSFEPEPAWAVEHYEHALKVMQDAALMMERTPSAYSKMEEEHLRDQFLVVLNGHFEGDATGETFNRGGKTDILLREKGRNVFIAECKFWRGPKAFGDAIDQLLGYTAWRDSKTAILVFVRDVAMSTALAGVKAVAESHPNFKQSVAWNHESGFRYVFHHPDDKNREFTLSILLFHIPSRQMKRVARGCR
jgi:hypothetical protein